MLLATAVLASQDSQGPQRWLCTTTVKLVVRTAWADVSHFCVGVCYTMPEAHTVFPSLLSQENASLLQAAIYPLQKKIHKRIRGMVK